jgi:hypothetical protein
VKLEDAATFSYLRWLRRLAATDLPQRLAKEKAYGERVLCEKTDSRVVREETKPAVEFSFGRNVAINFESSKWRIDAYTFALRSLI